MGQGTSVEVELMKDVAALAQDPTPWKVVALRFLDQPLTSAFYKRLLLSYY
jgi:hypothetical protein